MKDCKDKYGLPAGKRGKKGPKGEKGDKGQTGNQGERGERGDAGVKKTDVSLITLNPDRVRIGESPAYFYKPLDKTTYEEFVRINFHPGNEKLQVLLYDVGSNDSSDFDITIRIKKEDNDQVLYEDTDVGSFETSGLAISLFDLTDSSIPPGIVPIVIEFKNNEETTADLGVCFINLV